MRVQPLAKRRADAIGHDDRRQIDQRFLSLLPVDMGNTIIRDQFPHPLLLFGIEFKQPVRIIDGRKHCREEVG